MQKVNPTRSQRIWGVATLAVATIVAIEVAHSLHQPARPADGVVLYHRCRVDPSGRHGPELRHRRGYGERPLDRSRPGSCAHQRNEDAFVGDQSQVQVRMLTVVGGYYVTIIPLGKSSLGTHPIPKERVTMPTA